MGETFLQDSEANASELLENIEEMIPLCLSLVSFVILRPEFSLCLG